MELVDFDLGLLIEHMKQPFTEAQVREIGRLSEGLPGRIDQMSNVLLARIQSAGHGPDGRRFPALPQGHRGLLALLVRQEPQAQPVLLGQIVRWLVLLEQQEQQELQVTQGQQVILG